MADQYITFINRPTPIEDITADMQLYFSDNGKNKNKCKLFDNTGFAGLPDDAYSMADLRMNIQLGDTTSEDVVFSVDVIMEDGSYLSEMGDDYANRVKLQLPYEKASKLSEITWVKDVVKPLIDKLQTYEDEHGAPEKETCKSVIIASYTAIGDEADREGANARTLAKNIVSYITTKEKKLARMNLFDGFKENSKEYQATFTSIVNNITAGIESNNSNALSFFKSYPLNKKQDAAGKFIIAYSKGAFPILSKADLAKQKDSKKRLPKNIDEPEEILAAFAKHATDSLYKTKFMTAIKTKAAGTTDKDLQAFYNALYKALSSYQTADK